MWKVFPRIRKPRYPYRNVHIPPSQIFRHAYPLPNGRGLACPGVDLSRCHLWSPEVVPAILQQIHEYKGVIVFPDQGNSFSVQDQVEFAKLFGEPEIHKSIEHLKESPFVMEIQREKGEEIIFGEDWHSDHSFQAFPASFSILRTTEEITPWNTNNTEFANTIEAWSLLSPQLQQFCLSLKVSHSSSKAYGLPSEGGHLTNSFVAANRTKGMKVKARTPIPDELHPVVISHPVNGENALFVSETFTNGIDGMDEVEGMEFIMFLQKLMTQKKLLFEIPHGPNQVTMWDNRQLIHRALKNDSSARRVIHRVSVSCGKRPEPANKF